MIVQGGLYLVTVGGVAPPALGVRVAPGQHDVLVAAPDLDRWVWDRSQDPKHFLLR